MTDVLDRVRLECALVAATSSWVRIDSTRLATYQPPPAPAPERVSPFDDIESTCAFILVSDAINFGSGYHPYLRKPAGMSGSTTVATAHRTHAEREGPFSAEMLAALRAEDCARIFDQPTDGPAFALMGLFAEALHQLAKMLRERFDGSFSALVSSADRSAARLVDLLGALPSFHDVRAYRGREVPFYKRAQLAAADLGTAFFDDLDRLTMFADNLVPHVLRVDGVLAFEPALAARIRAGDLIEEGEEAEVEIRACAVHAVELLATRSGRPPRDIDGALWHAGGQPKYKAEPRHRTRTTGY